MQTSLTTPAPPQGSGQQRPTPEQRHTFLFIFLLAAALLCYVLWPFWSLLVLAALLAGISRPLHLRLTRRLPAGLAAGLTCLVVFLLIFLPLFFCIITLSSEAMTLYQLGRDGNLIDRLQEFVQNNTLLQQTQAFFAGFGLHFEPTDLSAGLRDLVKYVGLFLYNKASLWAANLMTLAFKFCLMLMVIFYLLLDMERLFDFVQRISPLPQEQGALLVRKFNEIGGAILIGNGASGLIQGTLGGLLFVLLDLKSPMIWGGVMCLTAFLPILGIGLVLIPTALVLMAMDQAGQGLLVLILYLAITFTIDYGLKPKLVGRHLHIHTLLVFLSIIGAMGMFGVLGIVFGPLVITLFLTLAEIYQDSYRPGNGGRTNYTEN